MTVYQYVGKRLAHTMAGYKWKILDLQPKGWGCPLASVDGDPRHFVIASHSMPGEEKGHWVYSSELLDVTVQPHQPQAVGVSLIGGLITGGSIRPVKAMLLTTDPGLRKGMPITSGVLDYFPLAIAAVAECSKAGNDQHNPGQPLHWAKEKSTDHADCIPRHLIDRGAFDTDGIRHSAKLAWRALALLQIELEGKQ